MEFSHDIWCHIMDFCLHLSATRRYENKMHENTLDFANNLRLVCKTALGATKSRRWEIFVFKSNVNLMRQCFPNLQQFTYTMFKDDFALLRGIENLNITFDYTVYYPQPTSFIHLRGIQELTIYFGETPSPRNTINFDEISPYLSGVQSLDVSGDDVEFSWKSFTHLRGIKRLMIQDNLHDMCTLDIDVFEPLTGIQDLYLAKQYTIPTDAFRYLKGIKRLHLPFCTYSGEAFKYFKGIESLRLEYSCVTYYDADFEHLAGIQTLQLRTPDSDGFNDCHITAAAFQHIKGVQFLYMRGSGSYLNPVLEILNRFNHEFDVTPFSAEWSLEALKCGATFKVMTSYQQRELQQQVDSYVKTRYTSYIYGYDGSDSDDESGRKTPLDGSESD